METLELKNTLAEIKNSINRFHSRFEAEQRITELEGISIASIQINTHREKRMKNTEKIIRHREHGKKFNKHVI